MSIEAATALVPYCRERFTFLEQLLLREAYRRMDWPRVHDLVWTAMVRSLNVPERLLVGNSSNYSSARVDAEYYNRR